MLKLLLKPLREFSNSILKLSISSLPIIGILIALIFFPSMLARCTSFEPVIVKDGDHIDLERSDYYTTLKFYAQGGVKDAAHIGTVYNAVEQADKRKLKEEKILKCSKLYFENGVVNKENREQYNLYLECLAK